MIPKKIHYCWLSGEEFPDKVKKCMQTWKDIMPDYEFILWDMDRFDINSADFVKEAVNVKKWAFASDYIRLHALYTEGGIYLDTDVIVKKSFDGFLEHDFFSAIEFFPYIGNKNFIDLYDDGTVMQRISGYALQSAIFGSVAGHPFLKDCLNFYKDRHFILPDGSFADKIISPDICATIAQKYGFRYKNEEQNLAHGMIIFPSSILASNVWGFTKNSFAIHCAVGGWRSKSFWGKLITNNTLVRKLVKRPPVIKDEYEFVQNSPVWQECKEEK
ncbi:MAG: polysaccharide biosynthesis protein [Chitinivibrionia bacterium]|nr:polysaccharide biosynthesis protein [Chitinivibrionia bacterium]